MNSNSGINLICNFNEEFTVKIEVENDFIVLKVLSRIANEELHV